MSNLFAAAKGYVGESDEEIRVSIYRPMTIFLVGVRRAYCVTVLSVAGYKGLPGRTRPIV
jgi:hypothetical protein